jgi:predicted nucleotidyltransferase
LSSIPKKGAGIHILYSPSHWELLSSLRAEALIMMSPLQEVGLNPIVYGSVTRGDVTPISDVDVFVSTIPSSFMLEHALEDAGLKPLRRVLIQATPKYAVKGYIYIDERRSFSFPLTNMRIHERQFYSFGGELSLDGLKEENRIPGVNKSLNLIEPVEDGHVEDTIVGREEEVASLLKIDARTVRDRTRALSRRSRIGRTGVFLTRELSSDETFEQVLKRLSDNIPAVRRKIRNNGDL